MNIEWTLLSFTQLYIANLCCKYTHFISLFCKKKKKIESLLELITMKKIRGYLNFYGKLIVSNKEMNTFTFSEAPSMKFSLEGDLKNHIS